MLNQKQSAMAVYPIDALVALRLDVDGDVHAELILRFAPIAARHRYRLIRRARDTHPDEIAVADNSVGRIEFNPTRSGYVELAPAVVAPPPSRPGPSNSTDLWVLECRRARRQIS